MADSGASGLGEEKEKEKEDKEREKRAAKSEKKRESSEVTETLGFFDKNGSRKGKKRNLSGEWIPISSVKSSQLAVSVAHICYAFHT